MLIHYDGKHYICDCTYEERNIPKRSGFFFDPIDKKWKTTKIKNAVRLRKYFTVDVKNHISRIICQRKPKSYSESFLKSIVPKNEKLKPVQVKAIKYALDRTSSYLALEQGLGKTATAIAILNALTLKHPVTTSLFVVTPNKIKDWVKDFNRWSVVDYNIIELSSEKQDIESFMDFHHNVFLVSDTFVSNENTRRAIFKVSDYIEFDLFVNDEAHRFGSFDSIRTKALYTGTKPLAQIARRRVLLSGTPIGNKTKDLYPILSGVAWNTIDFMTFTQFAMKFCDGYFESNPYAGQVLNAEGSSNIEELKQRIDRFMLVEKFDDHERVETQENLILIEQEYEAKFLNAQFKDLNPLSVTNYFDSTGDGEKIGGQLAQCRRRLSEIKKQPALEYIKTLIDKNPKTQFLFMGYHTELLEFFNDTLSNMYGDVVGFIDGSVKAAHRERICESYQSGRIKYLVAQVETMVGIDLFKGTYGVFIEPHWSPRAIEQAKSRLKRIGQTKKVTFDYLVLKDTIDEYVLVNYFDKLETINKTIRSTNNGK